MPWRLLPMLTLALLLAACGSTPTSSNSHPPAAFHPPADWVQVEARGYFTFWIPNTLVEQTVRGTDSYVGLWKGSGLEVLFDYGMYSGGMDSRISARPHTEAVDDSSGRRGTIVTYVDDEGNHVAELLVRDPGPGQTPDNLTFDANSGSASDADTCLLIVKSVRF